MKGNKKLNHMNNNNPYLDIDQQMVGDIYTSSQVMDNLTVLCDDFGARFSGTPEEQQAAKFIADTFEKYGLQNVGFETYSYAGWSRGEATLEIIEPIHKPIKCISLPYCPASEIESELISVGYGAPEDYQHLASDIKEKIVLASSASSPNLGRWVHRKEKYERTVLAGAKAFIFVSEHPGAGPETGSLQDDKAAPIPGISVSKEDGAFLTRLIERKGMVKLRLLTTDTNLPRNSWNIVGDLIGKEKPNEQIILGCHYDGHDISQGATDPASGMAIVIETARVLSQYAGNDLKRTVRFIAFGTEEIGLIGAYRYVDEHADQLDNIRFMFNLDAAGGKSRKGVVLHQWCELESFFQQAKKEMAIEMPIGQKVHPYSDHFPFLIQGIPTGHMGDAEAAPGGRGFGHTMYDTLDKVDLINLRAGSSVAARLALRMANDPSFCPQRRSTETVQELLDTDPNLEGYRVAQKLTKHKNG